ncbi:hypothetical protein ACWD62_41550 [Streptomyces sp. NPDC005146]
MYLIHAQLSAPPDARLPPNVRDLIRAEPTELVSIEHITSHADAPGGPVLGLFVAATSLEEAEQVAEAACRHALQSEPDLAGYRLVRCAVGFVSPFYERELP